MRSPETGDVLSRSAYCGPGTLEMDDTILRKRERVVFCLRAPEFEFASPGGGEFHGADVARAAGLILLFLRTSQSRHGCKLGGEAGTGSY